MIFPLRDIPRPVPDFLPYRRSLVRFVSSLLPFTSHPVRAPLWGPVRSLKSVPVSSIPIVARDQNDRTTDQERWARVKDRLEAEVGDDVYSSWFARMDLEGIDGDTVKLSVPTRFLKSWIQSHYAEKVLACWQAEQHHDCAASNSRCAPRCSARCRQAQASRTRRAARRSARRPAFGVDGRSRRGADRGGARCAWRLAARSAPDLRHLRGRPLQHARARGRQAGRAGAARRWRDVQSALHPCRRWARQDPSAAGDRLGRQCGQPSARCSTSPPRSSCTASSRRSAPRPRSPSRRRCARIDVLVIDDLQFLQGKSTQAEFCHTLNALIDAGRQVVIAADRPPSDLETLDERVRSRLAGGLVVEMGSLGEELRLRNPQGARRRRSPASSRLRCAAAGARLYRQDRHPQRARSRRRAQSPARPQQAHRPAGDARNGRTRGPRPDPPAGAQAGQDRRHPARGGAPVQCQPRRPARRRGAPPMSCARGRSPCTWPRR